MKKKTTFHKSIGSPTCKMSDETGRFYGHRSNTRHPYLKRTQLRGSKAKSKHHKQPKGRSGRRMGYN